MSEALQEIVARFRSIVGDQGVLVKDDDIQDFKDPYAAPGGTQAEPSIVVQPTTVEEVQAVVKAAEELGVHLWTSSTGRNYGYGGSAPVVDKAVVLNFRRMNKVLEINEEAGYALVEPGVRFFDLYNALREGGHKLWISVPDLGWGSVTGNALEHGYGYTVNGDNASAVCGMEVVLADGSILRTGQGAIPDSPMWQRHKRGFGPSVDSLFMQSNFGVVTKLGIWLMPEPESVTTGSVICSDESQMATVLDRIRPLLMENIIQGHPLITCAPEPPEGVRPDPMEDSAGKSNLLKMAATLPPGRMNARVAFYGPAALNRERERILRAAVEDIPGVTVELRSYAGDADPESVHPLDLVPMGIPNMFLLDMMKKHFGEHIGHIDFSPALPFDGTVAVEAEKAIQKILREEDLVAAFAWIANPRSLVGVTMIFFDTRDIAQRDAAVRAARKMMAYASERGWAEYRAHPEIIEEVAGEFSFNQHAINRFYSAIKDAVDPKGILSPGNHGIWGTKQRSLSTPPVALA